MSEDWSGGQTRGRVRLLAIVAGLAAVYLAMMLSGKTAAANAATATLGKTSVGASSQGDPANLKGVNRYALTAAGSVSKLSLYLQATGTAGQESFEGLIYAESGGAPGALLGTTSPLTFSSTSAAGWVELGFPAALKLVAGNYWIGFLSGGTSSVAAFRYDSVASSLDYNANTFTSGPSNPFGSPTVIGEQISLYATYTTATSSSRPSNNSLPTISGSAQTGATLTAGPGSWSEEPTSFAYHWQRCDSSGANCSPIPGASAQAYTPSSPDVGSTLRVSVIASNSAGPSEAALSAQTEVVTTPSGLPDVTGASDTLRTGWYPDEPTLTPELLSGKAFGQIFDTPLQGQIYAQPLTANGTLVVVTEEDWLYGLNPNTGAQLWGLKVGTPVNASDIGCNEIAPKVGITGTPVIDAANDVAYFVSYTYRSGNSGPVGWFMHAVDLATRTDRPGFPVEIAGAAQNLPGVTFNPTYQLQRPALLLMNGVVYAGFGGRCDLGTYQGWLVGVSTSGKITTMWAGASQGAAIWQSGGGLISDGTGQILFTTGNGNATTEKPGPANEPPEGKLGESVVRAAVQPGGTLKATNYFAPWNKSHLDSEDIDLGSGAPVALPSQYFGTPSVPNLLVQTGKEGYVYLLNRDNLGGFAQGPKGEDQVVQKLGPYGGVWDGLAVWPGDGGYVYVPAVAPPDSSGGSSDHLRFFGYGVEKGSPTLSLAATSPDLFGFGSGAPIVTSNATSSGTAIVWTTWCPASAKITCEGAQLRAYSPVPNKGQPQLLWSAPLGTAAKFARPDASNGHIYVGTGTGHLLGYGA